MINRDISKSIAFSIEDSTLVFLINNYQPSEVILGKWSEKRGVYTVSRAENTL